MLRWLSTRLTRRFLISLVTLFCLSSVAVYFSACFGGGRSPTSIVSYRDGLVSMKKGSYRVGALPDTWRQTAFHFKSLTFRHAEHASTVATNAFCGKNYEDASLEVLSRHLYMGIDRVKVESTHERMLDGRRALFTIWMGEVDGVPVKLETVSLQKNNCLFDFYYVASPETFSSDQDDFTHFVEGFSYP